MKLNEIFASLSGEPDGFNNKGGLATFIRFQGCNLDCSWCDTPKAKNPNGGYTITVNEVLALVKTKHVIITGGEPLLQREEFAKLVRALTTGGHYVSVETNGSIVIPFHASCLRYVVDYKLRSSCTHVSETLKEEVCSKLNVCDVLKFVIQDLKDYWEAKTVLQIHSQWEMVKVLSPVSKHSQWANILAERMIEDKLEGVILSTQLHKELTLR